MVAAHNEHVQFGGPIKMRCEHCEMQIGMNGRNKKITTSDIQTEIKKLENWFLTTQRRRSLFDASMQNATTYKQQTFEENILTILYVA